MRIRRSFRKCLSRVVCEFYFYNLWLIKININMEMDIMALMMEPIIELTEYVPYPSKSSCFIMTRII